MQRGPIQRTFLRWGMALNGSMAAFFAQPAVAAPVETVFVYPSDKLEASRLPDQLVQLRRDDPLLDPCTTTPAVRAFPVVLVPLIAEGFKALLGVVDKAMTAREDKRIAELSHSFAGNSAFADFPFRQPSQSCLVVDRVAIDGASLTSLSTYVIGFRRFGTSAISVELVGTRVSDTTLVRGMKDMTLNADIAVTMSVIEQPRDALAVQRTLGTFSSTIRNIDPSKPGAAPKHAQAPLLLPLPLPGAATSLTVAVTESNAGLAAVKDRIALQRKLRTKLLEFAGDTVEKKLGAQ